MEHPPLDDLSAFIDGELEAERRGEVEGHLGSCPACRTIASDLTELAADLRAMPAPRPTAAEREQWWNVVEQAVRPIGRAALLGRARDRQLPWVAGLAAAAVALVVVAVGFSRLTGSNQDDVAGPPPSSSIPVESFAPPTSLLPKDVLPNCHPTTSAARVVIDTGNTDQLETLIAAGQRTCTGPVTRQQAGSSRAAYTAEVASGVAAAGPCMQSLYDGTDAPLLPVYAGPASYDNQPALVVVFKTTFRAPPAPDDVLDTTQAWVMDEATCTPLNAAAD